MPLESKVLAGLSSAPGVDPGGFSFFQSIVSFRRSTRAGTPVPTTSVAMKTAPAPLKSVSVVHDTDPADARGLKKTATVKDTRKNTIATAATRNFVRDSPPRNPAPARVVSVLMRRTRLIVSGAILEGFVRRLGPRQGERVQITQHVVLRQILGAAHRHRPVGESL